MRAKIVSELTQEYVKSRLDYKNGCFYWKKKSICRGCDRTFNIRYSNKRAGSIKADGYREIGIQVKGRNHKFYEHRLIWFWHHGKWPKDEIDHINGNRADNRIENLREVTHMENQKNQKVYKNSTSGLMGVSWIKSYGKWHAYIQINYKHFNLGWYYDFFEACCVRKSAERRNEFHPDHGKT